MDFLIYTALPLTVLGIPVVLYIVGAIRRMRVEHSPVRPASAPEGRPVEPFLGDPYDDWDPASSDVTENPTREGPLRAVDEFFDHDSHK